MDERGRMVPQDRTALERAVAELEQADPRDARQLRLLGVGLLVLGRLNEAIERLRAALSAAGDDGGRAVAIHINLADAYRYAGRSDEAEHHYRYALALARAKAPERVHFSLQHLGKQRLDQERIAEARELFREALRHRETLGDLGLVESTRTALRLVDEAEASARRAR